MKRTVLSILAGVLVAMVFVALVETLGHAIWPPPPGLDPKNRASLEAAMAQLPPGALLSVAVAWLAGTFGGGWVAARFAGRRSAAYFIGGFVALAGSSNLLMLPHPFWFWIVALVLVPLTARVAGTLGARAPGAP